MTKPNERFADWLAREMPPGTVISNPRWWAPRIIAALTREQREGDPRKAALDELARENERLGLSYADAPQQEAPGAVAWLVVSERAGVVSAETNEVAADNTIRGVQEEYGDAYGRTYRRPLIFGDTTPPAPVDVRALRALVAKKRAEADRDEDAADELGRFDSEQRNDLRRAAKALRADADEIERALLDGQPAGVVIDDAMVERAFVAGAKKYAELTGGLWDEPDEHDLAATRAALQAALGGGGGES